MIITLEQPSRDKIVNHTLNGLHCIRASAALAQPVIKRGFLSMVRQSIFLLTDDDVVARGFERADVIYEVMLIKLGIPVGKANH